jgi:probable O-glycosylation ligase (exosortase A-associated)
MRDLFFAVVIVGLLPLAVARPFVGIILWSWLSFMNPHQIVWGWAGGIPWAMIVFLVTIVGCVVNGEPKRLALNGVTGMLLAFMACATLTTLVAIAEPDELWAYWTRVFKVMLGVMLTASLLTDKWRVHALIWIMVISVGFFGVSGGIFTAMTGGSYRVWGPPNTMIGDNNHVATGFLVTLPLMNYLRIHSRHLLVRRGMLVAMGFTLLGVLGTQSRGALIALGALTVMLWWRSKGKIVSGIVIAGAVAGAIAFMPASWEERMNTIRNYQQDESAGDRLVMWAIAWKLAVSRPLTGVGFTGPHQQSVVDTVEVGGRARAVHSIWFETLAEHGFLIFFVWVGISVAGFLYAMRLVRLTRGRPELQWANDLGRMVQVSIVAYHVGGTFLSLQYWDFYWTLLIAVAGAHALALKEIRAVGATGWRSVAAAEGWKPRRPGAAVPAERRQGAAP